MKAAVLTSAAGMIALLITALVFITGGLVLAWLHFEILSKCLFIVSGIVIMFCIVDLFKVLHAAIFEENITE